MKRFQFSLQALHHLRETQREQCERDLMDAHAAATEAAAELDDTRRVQQTARDAYVAKLLSGALEPHEATMHVNYIAALAAREVDARARLASLESECERRRVILADAARQHKVTTKLRERHSQRHAFEVERCEQINLDEMATLSTARRIGDTTL